MLRALTLVTLLVVPAAAQELPTTRILERLDRPFTADSGSQRRRPRVAAHVRAHDPSMVCAAVLDDDGLGLARTCAHDPSMVCAGGFH
jgi:hypothetical protein